MAFPTLKQSKNCSKCSTGVVKAGRRYDAQYCSPKCKQRAYAERLKVNAS